MTRQLTMMVTARRSDEIRSIAHQYKDKFGLGHVRAVPIVELLEVLPKFTGEQFDYEICSANEFGYGVEAVTYPDHMLMRISQKVYDAACTNDGRSRFTLAHELGHLILHRNQPPSFARATNFPIYCDCEWQSDEFGGYFMIDDRLIHPTMTVNDIMTEFCVTRSAAEVAYCKYKKRASK